MLHGKGNKATTRGFHPSATDALARWIDTRRQLGIRRGPLFCTLAGGPVHPQYVRNLLHRLGAKAGVDKRVHPHGLRHTFAWELERAGTPVTTISALLGHSGIAVTARYLAHLTNRQAVTALAAVDLPEVGQPAALPAPGSPGTWGRAQTTTYPENPGLPFPAAPIIGRPGRSPQGRLRRRCAAGLRPVPDLPARHGHGSYQGNRGC